MEKVVTSIRIRSDVFQALRVFSAYHHVTVSQVIEDVLTLFLSARGFYPLRFETPAPKEGEE